MIDKTKSMPYHTNIEVSYQKSNCEDYMEKDENAERYKNVGERLKIIRTTRHITQAQLAEAVGVGRLVIADAERGIRDLKAQVVVKICDVLDVDANWLLAVEPRDYIWDGMMVRTTVETLPASTGKTYTPLGAEDYEI